MSLLQELRSDKQALLNTTHSTDAQLNNFLDKTDYLLSDVLYRESVFNEYVTYLVKENGNV